MRIFRLWPMCSMPGACMRADAAGLRVVVLLLAILATLTLFGVAPDLDLWATGLFHVPGGGWSATTGLPEVMRLAVWRLSETLLLTCVGLLAFSLWAGSPVFGIPARLSGYVVTLYLIGPGLLVDGILKRVWGRARPADVVEFGGALSFTPPHIISDQCSRNCSFVSGEVAGAVAFAVALLALREALQDRLSPRLRRLMVGLALVAPVAVAAQRIAGGRHFLSDAVIAALLVLLVAALLRPLFFRAAAVAS